MFENYVKNIFISKNNELKIFFANHQNLARSWQYYLCLEQILNLVGT